MISAKEINKILESVGLYSKLLDKYLEDENSITYILPNVKFEPIRFVIESSGINIKALNQDGRYESWVLDDNSRQRGMTGRIKGLKSNNKIYYFDGML